MPDLFSKVKPVLSFIPRSAKSFMDNQYKTMKSVVRLDHNIYLLDYKNEYYLDELLESGVKSIGELIGFAAKKMTLGVNLFETGDGDCGCSTFEAHTPEGDHIMGRNFDFKEAPCFVLWTHPENAYASVSVVDCNFMVYGDKHNRPKAFNSAQALLAPYCCVDGINEKGLAIAVLQIRTPATNQQNPEKKDITTTSMIRAVLDKCATVDEAIDFIKQYNMHDSLFTCYHYQLVDKEKSVVVEYVNNELYIIDNKSELYENDGVGLQYVTNFYVKRNHGDEKSEEHGQDRGKYILNTLRQKNGVMTEMEAMDLLSRVKLSYQHPKYPWKIVALWSSVYNTATPTLKIAANTDYKNIYTFSPNDPYQVLKKEELEDEYKIEWEYL